MWWFIRCVDTLFLLDMVAQFFLAYTDKFTGRIVEEQLPIAVRYAAARCLRSIIPTHHPPLPLPLSLRRYLKFWFWVDLFAVFPYEILDEIGLDDMRVLRIVRLLRLFKLLRIFRAEGRLETFEAEVRSLLLVAVVVCLRPRSPPASPGCSLRARWPTDRS